MEISLVRIRLHPFCKVYHTQRTVGAEYSINFLTTIYFKCTRMNYTGLFGYIWVLGQYEWWFWCMSDFIFYWQVMKQKKVLTGGPALPRAPLGPGAPIAPCNMRKEDPIKLKAYIRQNFCSQDCKARKDHLQQVQQGQWLQKVREDQHHL